MRSNAQTLAGPSAWALVPPLLLPVSLLVASVTTVNMGLATLAYLLLVCGLAVRKDRALHGVLMGAGVTVDFGLVLFLQLTRNAVGTAAGGTLNLLQMIHIGSSVLAVMAYLPLVYLGLRARKGNSTPAMRRNHRLLGMGAFLFRTAGFFSMFSMLPRVHG